MDCSQALLSMEFSSQEYWGRLPFLSPGDLPNPGIEPWPSALQEDCLLSEPPGKLDRGVVVILSQGTGVACGPQVSTGALTLAPATSLPYCLELLKLDSGPWGHSTLSLARLALRGFLLLDTPHTVPVISLFLALGTTAASGHSFSWVDGTAWELVEYPHWQALCGQASRVSPIWRGWGHVLSDMFSQAMFSQPGWSLAVSAVLQTQEETPGGGVVGSVWWGQGSWPRLSACGQIWVR